MPISCLLISSASNLLCIQFLDWKLISRTNYGKIMLFEKLLIFIANSYYFCARLFFQSTKNSPYTILNDKHYHLQIHRYAFIRVYMNELCNFRSLGCRLIRYEAECIHRRLHVCIQRWLIVSQLPWDVNRMRITRRLLLLMLFCCS